MRVFGIFSPPLFFKIIFSPLPPGALGGPEVGGGVKSSGPQIGAQTQDIMFVWAAIFVKILKLSEFHIFSNL